jgi:hypothetical protein
MPRQEPRWRCALALPVSFRAVRTNPPSGPTILVAIRMPSMLALGMAEMQRALRLM